MPRWRNSDILVMRTSEIACNECHATDVAFCELVYTGRVTAGELLVFSASVREIRYWHPYVFGASTQFQVIMMVTMPSMNAVLESVMTSPHWRRLFVSV
jgi:hypothetical protein